MSVRRDRRRPRKQYFFHQSLYTVPGRDDQGESDKDSGDDEAPEFSNLERHQLLAAATLEIQDETGQKIIGNTNCNEVEEAVQNESRKRRRMTNNSSSARWRHMDMNRDTAGDWNITLPSLHSAVCLKIFLHLQLYEFICSETVRYARYAHSNGKHNFELSVDESFYRYSASEWLHGFASPTHVLGTQ